jgi:hypothetical protein
MLTVRDGITIVPASSAVIFDYYGGLRNRNGPQLRTLSAAGPVPDVKHIWVMTLSRRSNLRLHSRKRRRWQEAEAELEKLLSALEPTYDTTEAHDSYGVRVLLLSR